MPRHPAAFEHGPPARRAGSGRVEGIGARGPGLDSPAGGRGGRAVPRIGHQQQDRHAAAPCGQGQAPRGGKVEIPDFANHQADGPGLDGFFEGPKGVLEAPGADLQKTWGIRAQGRQAPQHDPAMIAVRSGLPDPGHRPVLELAGGQSEAGYGRQVAKAGFGQLVHALGPEAERKVRRFG